MSEAKAHPKSSGALPAAQAIPLGALVTYASGSIVSRAIVQNDAGSMTVFALDAGQALSEHTAPYDAHVLVLDGKAHLTVGGQAVEAGPGEAVRMPAQVPHSLEARERFKMLLVMIRA